MLLHCLLVTHTCVTWDTQVTRSPVWVMALLSCSALAIEGEAPAVVGLCPGLSSDARLSEGLQAVKQV